MKERKIRFNFIDVLIILLVAAVAFALVYIFVLSDKKADVSADGASASVRYVIQATDVEDRFDNLVSVGDEVFDAVTRKSIGTVVGVQTTPTQKIAFNYDEEKEIVVEVPDRITYAITIETDADESDRGFSVNGIVLKVGHKYTISLPDFYCSGYCIQLSTDFE